MKNLSSYCGLVDAKVRASDKNLPVICVKVAIKGETNNFLVGTSSVSIVATCGLIK